MEKREALKVWTIFLAILTFSLSLLGTFLVRSGVLTSVHSFASDPTRGIFILLILALFIGGSLALYAWRAPAAEGRAACSRRCRARGAGASTTCSCRPPAPPCWSARSIRWRSRR